MFLTMWLNSWATLKQTSETAGLPQQGGYNYGMIGRCASY